MHHQHYIFISPAYQHLQTYISIRRNNPPLIVLLCMQYEMHASQTHQVLDI